MGLTDGCPDACPGCPHRHLSPEQSLTGKQHWVKTALSRWQDCILPIQSSISEDNGLKQWGYREKICLAAAWDNDAWQIGLQRGDNIIAIPDCPVHARIIRETLNLLIATLPPPHDFPLAYYLQSGRQVTLIIKSNDLPILSWLTPGFTDRLTAIGIDGLWLHRHPSAGRRVTAKNNWDLLWGAPHSETPDGLRYGPTAFQQLIPVLFKQALKTAETFLDPRPDDLMLDLYCGSGSGLVCWTQHCRKVVGVELSGESVDCAKHNAPQAEILRGTGKDRLPQLTQTVKQWSKNQTARRQCLMYLNPPRTGVENEVLQWMRNFFRPARIAYLSCSAGTLNRDLSYLTEAGYAVERIIPYDFFPRTLHVETLVLVNRL